MPHRKSLSLHWRRIEERYEMSGTKCATCGETFFPPRPVCPNCRRKGKLDKVKLSGNGLIESHSTVYVPPRGFEYDAPYTLAIVKLDEGPKITGQIVDVSPEGVKIGDRVRSVFRKVSEDGHDGIVHYAFKFELVR